MMLLHDSGRMEEKHDHEETTCVWQHSHAQHGNELPRIRLGFSETRFAMRQRNGEGCEISEFP